MMGHVLLAKMVHLGAADASTCSSSSAFSHKHKARSMVASTAAQKMVVDSTPRLSPMLPHRCTLTSVLLQLLLEDQEGLEDPVVLHSWFEPFLNLVLEGCTNHKGVLHKVVGHDLVVLFNTAAEVNTAHRSSAAAFMLELRDSIFKGSLSAVLEVHMAAVTQHAYCAKWGTHDIASGGQSPSSCHSPAPSLCVQSTSTFGPSRPHAGCTPAWLGVALALGHSSPCLLTNSLCDVHC
eukprot:GGOE01025649.1.p1 GENE.GGOE01025649.1~~GGOE01025649.1.p1  ORF type:complete len:260 (-),score=60.92 GGOE01025649.1:232-939(-)